MMELLWVLLGSIVSAIVTLIIEHLRRPIITISTEIIKESFDTNPKRTHIQLKAENGISLHSFLGRSRANDMKGYVTIKGKNTYIARKSIRWCNSKQPNLPRVIYESYPLNIATNYLIYDDSYLREEPYVNIFAGDHERFDIFIFLHEKNEVYFFSNDSYKHSLSRWDYGPFRIYDNDLDVTIEMVVSGVSHVFKYRFKNALSCDKISVSQS